MDKKKTSSVLYILIGIAFLVLAAVFLFSFFDQFVTYWIVSGIALLLCGALYLVAFFQNKRGYFRPGWVLPQGLMELFFGCWLLFVGYTETNYDDCFIVFGFWAVFTAITQITASVQLKALEIRNWWWMTSFGVFHMALGLVYLLKPFDTMAALRMLCGIYFIVCSLCTVMESFLYRHKPPVKRTRERQG